MRWRVVAGSRSVVGFTELPPFLDDGSRIIVVLAWLLLGGLVTWLALRSCDTPLT